MSSSLMMFARRSIMTLQEPIEYDVVATVIMEGISSYAIQYRLASRASTARRVTQKNTTFTIGSFPTNKWKR